MTTFNNTTTPAFKLNASNTATAQPKHPLKVANNAPRKTSEDTFVKAKDPNGEVASAAVTTKQGNQWLLPVAGSMAGVLLAIGTFFVGKDLATKEALKVVREKSGQLGDDAEKLGANIAKAIADAKKPTQSGGAGTENALTETLDRLIAALPADQRDAHKDVKTAGADAVKALAEAVIAHTKTLDQQLAIVKNSMNPYIQTLSGQLEACGIPKNNIPQEADNFAQLLKLVETTMIDLRQKQAPPNSPVEGEVKKLYMSLVAGGTESDPVKMLEAITDHHDNLDNLDGARVESLKEALIDAKVSQDEINACGADFGSLLQLAKAEMQKPAPSRIPEDEAKLTALAKLTTTIEQAYQKTGDTTATNIEDKLTFLQKQAEEQVALLETKTDTIKQLEKLSKELATQLYTIHAEKTNAVGGEIASILEDENSPLRKILEERIKPYEHEGKYIVKSLQGIMKTLNEGFENGGSIANSNSVYERSRLGFFMDLDIAHAPTPRPTNQTQVARMLASCLEKPELNKQLNPKERQLITSYLDNLLAHPQAKASAHYRDTALHLLSPNTFEADTEFLQTAFENSVISPKLDVLFEHPLLDGFATPENKALILPHLQEALSQLHANPAQFSPTDQMTAPKQIVKRALELATKESTLTDFQEIKNLVSDTNLYPDGVKMTQKQALATVINNLNAKLGGGGTTNTALLYQASPQDSGSALSPLFKILESVKLVAALSIDSPDRPGLKEFQNKIEFPLIKGFAELHFHEVIEKHRNDEALRPKTISSSGLLGIMKEATKALDDTDPKKQKLQQAIANLRKLHEHIESIKTSVHLTS